MREPLDDFEGVYDANVDRVRGILFRLAQPSDLDDLTQETFLKVWKSYNFFRRHSKSSTWIYRIALNTAYDYLRKKKQQRAFVEAPQRTEAPRDMADVLHMRRVALEALNSLKPELRALVVLRIYEGFSEEECAKILDLSVGTVKSRLSRAKTQLAETLEKKGVEL